MYILYHIKQYNFIKDDTVSYYHMKQQRLHHVIKYHIVFWGFHMF